MPTKVNLHLNLIHTRPCSLRSVPKKADCRLCLFCTPSIVVETRRQQQRLAIFEPIGLIILVQRIFAVSLLFVSPKSFVSTMARPQNKLLDDLLGAVKDGMGLTEEEFFAKFHLQILGIIQNLGLDENAQFELLKPLVCVDSPNGPIKVKECYIPLVEKFFPTWYDVVHNADIENTAKDVLNNESYLEVIDECAEKLNNLPVHRDNSATGVILSTKLAAAWKCTTTEGARKEAKDIVDDLAVGAKFRHKQALQLANEKIVDFVAQTKEKASRSTRPTARKSTGNKAPRKQLVSAPRAAAAASAAEADVKEEATTNESSTHKKRKSGGETK